MAKETKETKRGALHGEEDVIDLLAPLEGDEGEDERRFTVVVAGEPREYAADELAKFAQSCVDELAALAAERTAPAGAKGNPAAEDPEIAEFVSEHPDVSKLPPEVVERLKTGKGLLRAYSEYENEQLKNKLRAYEQNSKNAESSAGSARGDAVSDEELDEMLAVFDSVFKN